jgi:hypothetical protein
MPYLAACHLRKRFRLRLEIKRGISSVEHRRAEVVVSRGSLSNASLIKIVSERVARLSPIYTSEGRRSLATVKTLAGTIDTLFFRNAIGEKSPLD